MSDYAKRLQLEVGELAQQRRWAQAYTVLFNTVLPHTGIKRLTLKPLLWLGAQVMALDAPQDPTDMVVTIAAEDQFNFKDRLAAITVPTLVVAGTRDPFYTPALFRETAAGIPNARLILYEGVGHPAGGKQFRHDVLAFLREDSPC